MYKSVFFIEVKIKKLPALNLSFLSNFKEPASSISFLLNFLCLPGNQEWGVSCRSGRGQVNPGSRNFPFFIHYFCFFSQNILT